MPYDPRYENLFLAFIAGLCGFGLIPRATLELPGPTPRLDRILDLIAACRYSFHDLSRVELSHGAPRFNMPFELGLVVGGLQRRQPAHEWFVFEARRFRLQRSLSDLNGTDPHIHGNQPRRVLVELTNALVRADRQPTIDDLDEIYRFLRRGAARIRKRNAGLYGARAFRELVVFSKGFIARKRV
jgi:hypothetical protein